MNILRPRSVFLRVAHQFFPAFALKDKELDFGSTTLYLILFFLASEGKIDISQNELAEYCKASKRTVQKYLKNLEKLDYIKIENLKYSINTYTLLHSARVQALVATKGLEIKEKVMHYELERPVQNLHTPHAESAYLIKNIKEIKHTHIKPSCKDDQICTQLEYVECETSTTDIAMHSKRKAFLAKEKKSVVEGFKKSVVEDFEKIWAIYPIKQNYKSAQNIFFSLTKKETLPAISTLLEAIQKHLESDRRWKAGYAPSLSNWLKDERWNDEAILEKIKETSTSCPVVPVSNSKFSNEEIEQIKKNALQFKNQIIEKEIPQVKEEKNYILAQNISNLLVDTWKKKGFEASIIEGYCHTLYSENMLPPLEKMKFALEKQCYAPLNIFKWLKELGNDENSQRVRESRVFGSNARNTEIGNKGLAVEQNLFGIERARENNSIPLSFSILCASIFNSKKEKGRTKTESKGGEEFIFASDNRKTSTFAICSNY